jgi:pyruvate formate lyase activating enzyme
MSRKTAKYWHSEGDNSVRCELCPHGCLIRNGKRGICRVRRNDGGVLISDAFAEVISLSVDPIEKKPLYHFYPGSDILSTGPRGCNFSCGFCQNWEISQKDGATNHIEPSQLVSLAEEHSSIGIAYTYTEPVIAFEFVIETGKIAKEAGLKNVLVTNGFIEQKPLIDLLDVVDALNVDLKSMNDEFYRNHCGGRLEPVLRTIELCKKQGTHIEITNLLIPSFNDSEGDIRALVDFIETIDPLIPVHFSGYYPCFHFTAPPTAIESLLRAFEIASAKLPYVYIGNRRTEFGTDTFCPQCGNRLVSRCGFSAKTVGIDNCGKCNNCGRSTDIVGSWTKN